MGSDGDNNKAFQVKRNKIFLNGNKNTQTSRGLSLTADDDDKIGNRPKN